jgi:hypothetical protein
VNETAGLYSSVILPKESKKGFLKDIPKRVKNKLF